MIRRRRESNRTQEKQGTHNRIAHHLLRGIQTIPQSAPLMCNFPGSYAGHDILCYGILLWAAWVSCLGHSPAELFMQPLTSSA